MAKQPLQYGLIPDESDSTLVGAWLNAATSGSEDFSSNGNDGTDTGITHEDWGAELDGSTSYITIPDDTDFDFGTGDFTLCAWIRPDAISGAHWIYDQRDAGDDGVLFAVATNKIRFVIGTVEVNSTANATIGKFQHVCVVRESNVMKIYLDATLDATTGDATGQSVDTTTNPVIGARSFSSATNFFDGRIADLRIYTEAKTADEVKTAFEAGVPDSSLVLSMQGDITDESVYGLAFTPQADAIVGAGYELDGTGDYLLNSTADWRSGDSVGTIMAWIKLDAVGGNYAILASADTATTAYTFSFQVTALGTARLAVFQSNNDTADLVYGSTTLAVGTWVHAALVSDGSAWSLYHNGRVESLTVNSGANTGDWFADTTNRDNVTLGGLLRSSLINVFCGTIDDVRVFNRTLSADEIATIYDNTEGKY
jgi:hypothetical protein